MKSMQNDALCLAEMKSFYHRLCPYLIPLLLVWGVWPGVADASLQDEIQVYDDSINRRGDWGLELHVNSTPSGVSRPGYPGEITNVHGIRTTPEISYGLTDTLEAGLYLPVVHQSDNATEFAGPRVRMKWIPKAAPDGGVFYGMNVEVSAVKPQYEIYQNGVEFRPIIGLRTEQWLLVGNPVLDFPLRSGYHRLEPYADPAFKIGRTVQEGVSMGVEYYSELGRFSNIDPLARQANVLFLALDVDRKPWVFNLGVGRGLTQAADGWTLKGIFEIPFD